MQALPYALGFCRPGFGEPPVGALMAFAGSLGPAMGAAASPPTAAIGTTEALEAWGWMLCDGRTLNVGQYPELFAALGYVYGGSADSFLLPDYRGYFWRGTDSEGRVDKDAQTRTDPAGTTQVNSGVGSIQPFAVQTHAHTYNAAATAASPGEGAVAAPSGTPTLTSGGPTSSLSAPGDVKVSPYETRPSNIYVNYIIKFTYGLHLRS